MKRSVRLGLILALMLTPACTPDDTITIGVVAPLTGGQALWGQGSANIIQLAVDEINKEGGVNGKQIELIMEDGKCNSQAASRATQKLINVNDVDAILGGHCSPETVAMVPIINRSKTFMLGGVTAADGAVNGSDFAFRTSPPTLEQAEQITKIAERRGIDTIATLTEDTTYAESFTRDIEKTFDGEILTAATYDPGTQDFRTQLTKIRSADPDAIWISPQDPSTAVSILQDMQRLDMLETQLFGNTVFVSENVHESSDGLLPEDAFSVTLFADPTTPRFTQLQEKYRERYGEPIPYNNYYVGATYDATYMLTNALEQCGKDTRCITNYFDGIDNYDGVAGNYTFEENGDPVFDNWREIRIANRTAQLSTV